MQGWARWGWAAVVLSGCFDVGLGEDPPPAVMESPPGPCAIMDVDGEAAAVDAVRDQLECRGHDPAALRVECGPPFEHWLYNYDPDTGTVGEWRVDCQAFLGDQLLAVRTVTVGIARQIEVLPRRGILSPECPGRRRPECHILEIYGAELPWSHIDTPSKALAALDAWHACQDCDLAGVTIDCWGPVWVEAERRTGAGAQGVWLEHHCRVHHPNGSEFYPQFPFDTF
ncbi:MAG: hypothetical protein ACI9U2_004692 [Bradymonadia bacterium]|jgi:hypothetical protein